LGVGGVYGGMVAGGWGGGRGWGNAGKEDVAGQTWMGWGRVVLCGREEGGEEGGRREEGESGGLRLCN
jgi:hypothetical protein